MSWAALPTPGDVEARDEVAEREFDAFYRAYAPRVEALAWRRLHDRHGAEDAVQETFLRAYRSYGRIDGSRPVWPWLRTIATNVCVDMLRLRRHLDRDGSLDEDEATLVPAATAKSDPGEVHLATQRRRSIATALDSVNARQRRVVILRDVEGWENEEVAQLEGITLDAVKSALKRGRQTFRASYLALADREGLLGGILVGTGGAFGRLRRLAVRLRAAVDASRIGALVPMAPLLPLAIVATLASGVVAAQFGAAHAEPQLLKTEALQHIRSDGDVPSDTLAPRTASLHGGSASGAGPAAAATGASAADAPPARVIAPLGERDDMSLGATLQREDDRTLLSAEFSLTGKTHSPIIEYQGGIKCDSDARETLCDVVDQAWPSAPSVSTSRTP